MIIALLVLLVSQEDREKSHDFFVELVYNKRETMTETKETSFDGYVSSTDRCRDLFGSEGQGMVVCSRMVVCYK